MHNKIQKTDEEWRRELTPEQYRVTRCKGTEPAFSGEYYDCHQDGVYHCVCCDAPLFQADHKFDSGSGWPSFYRPMADDAIAMAIDHSLGMRRTEALCQHCDAHLGHVFADGPKPTGLRYCINSVALVLKPESS